MNPYDNKALMKVPSFSSAPNLNAPIPIPSFSSAPDFSATNVEKEKHKSKRDDSPEDREERSSRRRSRSPRSRRRSRSPRSRRRSRSPHSRRSSRSPRRRHRSRSPRRHRHRSSERSSRRSKRTPSPEIVHTGTLSTGISFVMDRRGDSNNVKYGGNHSYNVPEYRRSGSGRVLGLPDHLRIDKSVVKSGTIALIDKSKKKRSRYTDSDYAWKESDKSLKRIRIKPKQNIGLSDPFGSSTEFIQFDDKKSKSQLDEDDRYISSGVDYRSLEGNKVKSKEDDDQMSEEEEGESFNDQIRQRTIDYNRRLDKEPENVQLWLEFIKFQDEAAAGLDPTASKTNRTSLNEVKLSIFEKALDYNPQDQDLILAYLNCGAETWETLKLLREWDAMLKEHPDSIKLWSEYINLRQTNFASFTFTQCVQVFEDALSILGKQGNMSHDDETKENIQSLMVYILLRACLFMKQSGYYERAFALIQAIVEFNLFQPSLFYMASTRYEDKVNAFIEFWDSEVLRFGEEGALGWQEYYRISNNGEDIPEPIFGKKIGDEDEDEIMSLKDWYNKEIISEEKDRLPLRMTQVEDDSVDEDPYRIILSDDIKPFLFNTTTIGARYNLIYSIFVFLGLPYTPSEVGTNTHFFTDTFTHNDLPLNNFWPAKENKSKHLVWYINGIAMNPEQTLEIKNPYYIPNSYPVGLSELFAKQGTWFKSSGKEFIPNNVDEKFTRNVFQQLLSVEKSEHLNICYLAFESSCGYKMGRRLAKHLLKDQTTNLTLWNAYAQMEKSHDRIDEARKVYLTALSMYHSFPESDQISAPLLYFMFAKLEMENKRPNEALKILVSMSDNKPYNETTPLPTTLSILRTREYFSQRLVQVSILSESSIERRIAFNLIGCCALFEYLSSGLESACSIYENTLDYIKGREAERGYESEIIWIEYAALLYQHATNNETGGYKASMLRNAMERAIKLFPNNTIFLSFYIWNESKTKIYNRVHDLLNKSLQESNVILWLSAIYSELHRYKPFQVNSVRDFFERSISDTRTKSSIILWKYYIQFEIMQGNTERAHNLYYRSIRECPWSKELYLIGIKYFDKTMSKRETNELVSLMMEKEIRLRYPIDEDLLA